MFTETIIEWYKENKRDLPWRDSSDPYLIWISEVVGNGDALLSLRLGVLVAMTNRLE